MGTMMVMPVMPMVFMTMVISPTITMLLCCRWWWCS
jgi:hypothetical protein